MAKAKSKKLKCDVCGKMFLMPAHLGRHMTAMHGTEAKTKRRRSAAAAFLGGKRRRPGRPPAIASRFGLNALSMDELAALISAARDEAGRRLRDYQDLLAN
ncbi:MAG: C2H2-type zinc finger protein [Phycisphaerae bacterium]|nr:C2H2-type zinc finger protein [Phycisphaerae bacterium]